MRVADLGWVHVDQSGSPLPILVNQDIWDTYQSIRGDLWAMIEDIVVDSDRLDLVAEHLLLSSPLFADSMELILRAFFLAIKAVVHSFIVRPYKVIESSTSFPGSFPLGFDDTYEIEPNWSPVTSKTSRD